MDLAGFFNLCRGVITLGHIPSHRVMDREHWWSVCDGAWRPFWGGSNTSDGARTLLVCRVTELGGDHIAWVVDTEMGWVCSYCQVIFYSRRR